MSSPLDAPALAAVMRRFADALREHREELNSLNVFPVPDGDTGTNMLQTQEAVVRALDDLGPADLPETGDAIARASLMGARGNSGVILSQVLRGLVTILCADGPADSSRFADALAASAREAYAAVARPLPGTVLTVLDAAAEAARTSAERGADLSATAADALRAAGEALARTPDLLPELARARVVDAGGRGALLLFDALAAVIGGRPLEVGVGPLGPVGREEGEGGSLPPVDLAYEVMYLLEAPDEAVPAYRERLGDLGDSIVVVGGGGLYNVHVHTNDPDAAVEAGRTVGVPAEVRVTDLADAVEQACLAGQARAVQVAGERVGLVAVVDGGGLAELFRSLGAVVVPGGPGANPAVRDIREAIEATGSGAVVVLPNHRNVIPAAEQAGDAARADVLVVASRSVPEGLAAAACFNPTGEPRAVAEEMARSAASTAGGEIVRAERDADTPAGPVHAGQWLGLSDGEVRAAGADPASAAALLVSTLRRETHEIVTLFVGADAGPAEADRVRGAIESAAPGLEVEVHTGGQPRFPYLVGLE